MSPTGTNKRGGWGIWTRRTAGRSLQSLSRKPQYVFHKAPGRSTTPCCHDTFTTERKETGNANSKRDVTIHSVSALATTPSPPLSHTLTRFHFFPLTRYKPYDREGKMGSPRKQKSKNHPVPQIAVSTECPFLSRLDGYSIFSSNACLLQS